MQLSTIDLAIVGAYALALIVIATVVSREKAGHAKDSTDYFLAGKSLPWWAVGASLIAANISAEQIIGMSGSGYVVGLAIASYEWMAAATLLIVGKYFLPIFLKRKIYTMPQFLDQRYGHGTDGIGPEPVERLIPPFDLACLYSISGMQNIGLPWLVPPFHFSEFKLDRNNNFVSGKRGHIQYPPHMPRFSLV